MPVAAGHLHERIELERILASGVFQRAPNLANILIYICEKHFEGEADQIKEYNIAVEALGRPADFDQKKDAIVRVEMHRLRRRLREYYQTDGATRPTRIEVPPGQYAPKFVLAETAPLAADDIPCELNVEALPEPTRERRRFSGPVALAVMAIVIAAGWIGFTVQQARRAAADAALESALEAAGPSRDIRILAGLEHGAYTDGFDRVWQPDRYFTGGSAFHIGERPITGAYDSGLYENRREGAFAYDIPLAPGVYELRLYFAETLYGAGNLAGGGETSRLFHVFINGREALHEFDVIGCTGPGAACVQAFRDISPASDGKLHLRFVPKTATAFVNAIEITPGIPGRTRPLRVIAAEREYRDLKGHRWAPDRMALGGQLVSRAPIAGAEDADLYRGERFGNFRYRFAVPQGRYAVTLHFSERWFGPGKPGGGGAGSRLFDVLANGVALARRVDIYSEAGGPDRPLVRRFTGVEPNAQGQIEISFIPVRNYASVNAIEIAEDRGWRLF